jgi:TetR/AcrR family transcriptional regulator, cholesterol catabolism regulator
MNDSLAAAAPAPSGRRERNKQRVRARLYDSALRLFTEKGYEQTSVDQIAEDADVARGTFFNHFQRKEDLITAWGAERRLRLREGLAASEPGHTGHSLRQVLDRCMDVLADINERDQRVTRAMLIAWVEAGRPILEEPFAGEIFAEVVEAARQRGEITSPTNTRLVGNLLRDAYLGALYRWSQKPESADPRTELRTELHAVVDIVVSGVGHTPNRETA